jgi:hypothetical protein
MFNCSRAIDALEVSSKEWSTEATPLEVRDGVAPSFAKGQPKSRLMIGHQHIVDVRVVAETPTSTPETALLPRFLSNILLRFLPQKELS